MIGLRPLLSAFLLLFAACTRSETPATVASTPVDKPGIAARIGEVEISNDQLINGDRIADFQLRKALYDFRKRHLDHLVRDQLLNVEAKANGVSVDQLTEKTILSGTLATVSSKEVDAFAKEKNLDPATLKPDDRTRFATFLKSQRRERLIDDHVRSLAAKARVDVYFESPRFAYPTESIERPHLGPAHATHQIIEVNDFRCAKCSDVAKKVRALKDDFAKKIEVSFLYLPSENRVDARPLAEASLCAFRAKPESFWSLHDQLLAHSAVPISDIASLIKNSGAPIGSWTKCRDSKEADADLQKHMSFADDMGIRTSPAIFIDGTLYPPDTPIAELKRILTDELSRAN